MVVARQDSGRVNQKRRTELALVHAAQQLMRAGQTPTVAEVAEAALVSKATAYRYFIDQQSLLLEASQVAIPPPPDGFGAGLDVVDRVDGAAQRIVRFTTEHQRFIRTVIRAALDRWLAGDDPAPLRRGYRMPWLQAALEPLQAELDGATYERLLQSLAVLTSFEAVMVLTDVLGVSTEDAAETIRWATRTLTGAVIGEAGQRRPGGHDLPRRRRAPERSLPRTGVDPGGPARPRVDDDPPSDH